MNLTDWLEERKRIDASRTPGPWPTEVWINAHDGSWAAVGPKHMPTDEELEDNVPGNSAESAGYKDALFIADAGTNYGRLVQMLEVAVRALQFVAADIGTPASKGAVAVLTRIEELMK